jgi:hypothetical protein
MRIHGSKKHRISDPESQHCSMAPVWTSTAPEFWFCSVSDPDPAFDFDVDPEPAFYLTLLLMLIWIRLPKMMRNWIPSTASHYLSGLVVSFVVSICSTGLAASSHLFVWTGCLISTTGGAWWLRELRPLLLAWQVRLIHRLRLYRGRGPLQGRLHDPVPYLCNELQSDSYLKSTYIVTGHKMINYRTDWGLYRRYQTVKENFSTVNELFEYWRCTVDFTRFKNN